MSITSRILIVCLTILAITFGVKSKNLNELSKTVTPIVATKKENSKIDSISINIYVPNKENTALVSKQINLKETEQNKTAQLKLITTNLIKILNEQKILKEDNYPFEIYLKDKDIYLDLDSKILLCAKTPQEELLIIYSFVNTLISAEEADKVIILINGDEKDKVNFVNLSKFYKLNTNI